MKKTGTGGKCNKGNPQIDKFSRSFPQKTLYCISLPS